ncbi:MAG: CofH family radical SAM protein, partial [Rikenellaceae bacterium]|nr:CofH family radical SAM protein [Rikenellaceae bacterium]
MTRTLLLQTIPSAWRPLTEKIMTGCRITPAEAQILYDQAPLALLGTLAAGIKAQKSGNSVFYNRNFHIEPTNICTFHCKFCSYRRPADSPEAWNYTLEEVLQQAGRYAGSGVTEVHIVGGVHPDHDLYDYAEMICRIREILPEATVKAFSAVKIDHMIQKAGLSIQEGLLVLKEAGMQTMPGGGAEIFDEELRRQICGEKSSSQRWLDIHRTAHRLGMPTNATMLYGHLEEARHRIDHLNRLRHLQDETGGFNAFIPLKYRNLNNELSDIGEVPVTDDLRTLAISRIFLDNFPHIKAYWPMYGKETTQLALGFGANDIDGTIGDTTKIYSMAGAADT